ncbi:pantoate--beta-alanine ligase [Bacillus solimangrovi]|uniref:Pantothenate synthetase n=1 Tax=Bacillus solimangrovi TaxID=1305675 RepID=A0A1E5LH69_9BACI|nr:pantoate--beta-alanine ligase [Bacillus solimangrovi]OEH93423.1 pantoate--beta-alanine ligase [Bacillus solimangrovi]
MKVIQSIQEMQQQMRIMKKQGYEIGFVPTMGYLHEGHLTLVEQARRENDVVVMSIFVNPLQFGPNEDFERYPRDFERDERLAEEKGVDFLFYPHMDDMYPEGFSIKMTVENRVNVLCGESRPGHFDGVVTVLAKLFNIVLPDRAYFGMKDAQQVAVVEGLIADYNFPVKLVPVKIIREQDGLAKSSRNVYLTDKERSEAPQLFRSLQQAATTIEAGERVVKKIIDSIRKNIDKNTSGKIDYVEILSYPDLETLTVLEGRFIIALAVQFERARLIDNITITLE